MPECNPSFESVHCIARLNEDISAVLPLFDGRADFVFIFSVIRFQVVERLTVSYSE